MPPVIAVRTDTSPDAIGRCRFVGCRRSASTSSASFRKYVPLAARQKQTNAIAVRAERGAVAEHAGRAGRGDDEHVLDPLLGPGQPDERGEPGRRSRRSGPRLAMRPLPGHRQISSGSCSTTCTRSSSVGAAPAHPREQERGHDERGRRRHRRGSRARCAGSGRVRARPPRRMRRCRRSSRTRSACRP